MANLEELGGKRPSPEALLREAERAERSRLKIFLGAAPGVGKTYAMLEAAWERKQQGEDVVVGVVETHGRKETEELLQGLEVIPRKRIEYRGRTLEEMDIDAILARRPKIVLVDELAHTNVPGARHPKRYSDVEEILDAGIDVYSTVNIQHLESLNDVVAQITGVRIRETVPDGILERADEIKLVDLPPEDLIQRLREGKVYIPPQAERAIENYFRPGNLTALRELALRHAAERVDDEVQAYMQAHAVAGTWAVSERVMVCVSDGPLAVRLVRAARRIAARRRAEWIAVFVETPAFHRHTGEERERVGRALRLAEQLGAEAVTIPGNDVAAELIRYAHERNVTEIILGKSLRPWWRSLFARSPIPEIIRRSGDIEVRVISATQGLKGLLPPPRPLLRLASPINYLVAVILVGAAGLLAKLLRLLVELPDPSMLFLTAVLVTAVVGGLIPSIVASVLGLLVYDLFFVEPLYTFTVTKPKDFVSLVVYLIVGIITSQLTARIRDQAEAARQREARTNALYDFSRELAGAVGLEDLIPAVVRQLSELFAGDVVVLGADEDRLVLRGSHPASTALNDAEMAAAAWVWRHDEEAGPGTETLPGSEWLYVPLATARGVVGVVGLRAPKDRRTLSIEQRELLRAVARQAAIAIERCRIDVVLEEKAKTEQIIEASEDGIIVLDPSGVVIHVNEVACAILEMEHAEVVGRRFENLEVRHTHYLRLREAVRDFLEHPTQERERLEISLFLRGRDHYYVLRPTPFRTRGGTPAGLILALQDVTYLRDQERRRENLVATLSHELGTPLTSMRMAVEMLKQRAGKLDTELRGFIDVANEDVQRLADVSQRFLDLARSRAMTIAVERRPVDLSSVIARVVRLFTIQASEKGVTLETARESPGTISGDEIKLTWALSNLIANAIRYTPAGGRVRVATESKDGTVAVSVTDTGPGIPPEQQDKIFERFVQSASGGDAGAAGLGLAIVRDVVQAHGGRIHLESAVGRGTRFTLELPKS
ncbi:MAG TPA: ATP-binding protein [Candidatus Binatia bacterium]|nr:ATP-binding protein [Candidatus Binatia bacterium]